MNGFEPLRRRVIDYTAAGQWQEVYVGPIEECEEYRLKAENEKLRELCSDMFRDFANCDYELRRHGKTFMAVTRYSDRMRELGIEVKP